jgi:peroxin-19
MLDDFANTTLDTNPATSASTSTTSGPGRPEPDALLEAGDDEEFAKQLQAEMEQLLGQKDFAKQFEGIMKEMGEIGPGTLADAEAGSGSATPITGQKAEADFQDTIRKTMERMQASGDHAGAAATASAEDDILAQMLKEMESGGFGGEGRDEDFSSILMGMMEQLTNRDVLYEPMKELNDKFPNWMDKNRGKVKEDDLKRYEQQQQWVKEITARFEQPGYSDGNAGDREYIVERMQKV